MLREIQENFTNPQIKAKFKKWIDQILENLQEGYKPEFFEVFRRFSISIQIGDKQKATQQRNFLKLLFLNTMLERFNSKNSSKYRDFFMLIQEDIVKTLISYYEQLTKLSQEPRVDSSSLKLIAKSQLCIKSIFKMLQSKFKKIKIPKKEFDQKIKKSEVSNKEKYDQFFFNIIKDEDDILEFSNEQHEEESSSKLDIDECKQIQQKREDLMALMDKKEDISEALFDYVNLVKEFQDKKYTDSSLKKDIQNAFLKELKFYKAILDVSEPTLSEEELRERIMEKYREIFVKQSKELYIKINAHNSEDSIPDKRSSDESDTPPSQKNKLTEENLGRLLKNKVNSKVLRDDIKRHISRSQRYLEEEVSDKYSLMDEYGKDKITEMNMQFLQDIEDGPKNTSLQSFQIKPLDEEIIPKNKDSSSFITPIVRSIILNNESNPKVEHKFSSKLSSNFQQAIDLQNSRQGMRNSQITTFSKSLTKNPNPQKSVFLNFRRSSQTSARNYDNQTKSLLRQVLQKNSQMGLSHTEQRQPPSRNINNFTIDYKDVPPLV